MVANPDLTLLWWADGDAGGQAKIWKDIQANGVKTIFLATDMPPTTFASGEGWYLCWLSRSGHFCRRVVECNTYGHAE